MNTRIKALRNALNLTQEEFANRLGIKRNTVGNYETGNRIPSKQTITSICREYSVNEMWLREGKGEMFSLDDVVSLDDYARILGITPRERAIIEKFLLIDPAKREFIINIISDVFVKQDEQSEIDAKVEAYRRELELEKRAIEGLSPSLDMEENA